MRSKKLIAVVVLAAGSVTALLLAAFATGASQSPGATVGSGTASATKSVCGLGTGKKATGKPIKLGGIAISAREKAARLEAEPGVRGGGSPWRRLIGRRNAVSELGPLPAGVPVRA